MMISFIGNSGLGMTPEVITQAKINRIIPKSSINPDLVTPLTVPYGGFNDKLNYIHREKIMHDIDRVTPMYRTAPM